MFTSEFSKDMVLETLIPSTVKLKDTEVDHKPINIRHPKENVRSYYDNIISELLERGVL